MIWVIATQPKDRSAHNLKVVGSNPTGDLMPHTNKTLPITLRSMMSFSASAA
jgi:hypothetical protein